MIEDPRDYDAPAPSQDPEPVDTAPSEPPPPAYEPLPIEDETSQDWPLDRGS